MASPLSGAIDRLAPPLQANFAEAGLAHLLGDAGKLDIEGIKGKESARAPAAGRTAAMAPVGIAIPRDAS